MLIVDVIMLMVDGASNRLEEDGVMDALEAAGVEARICYADTHKAEAEKSRDLFVRTGVRLACYPHPSSEIFYHAAVEGAAKGGGAGAFRGFGPFSLAEFLAMLEENGIRTLPVHMHFGGPFDFEVALMERPAEFAARIRAELDKLPPRANS